MTLDWTSFHGHIATAGQMPAYLQALVSARGATRGEREDKRGGAYEHLFAQLVKDGQWLPVSPHVAAELVGIARTGSPGRWRVLRLLGEMVSGKHQWWLARGVGRERDVGELEAATRQVVLPLRDDACRMLDDPDPALRSAAAFFLGCLGAPDEAALRQLEAHVAEEEVPCALASALLALAALRVISGKPKLDLEPYLDESKADPFVVGAATLAALMGGAQTPTSLGKNLFLLSELRGNSRSRPALDAFFCWGGKDLASLEGAIVKGLGPNAVEETIDVLLSELPSAGAPLKALYSRRLMSYGGFVERWKPDERALVEELTPRQRQIAETLAVSGPDGGYGHGLPRRRRFLSRWLGLEAPTLLDGLIEVDVDGERVSRPRWWAWKHAKRCQLQKADIDAFVLGLDARAQLRLIVDCEDQDAGIRAPSLRISRTVELVEQVPADGADWALEWAAELMRSPTQDTGAGPVTDLPLDAGYPLLRALLRAGVPIRDEWVVFTPWGEAHVRRVLERLPAGFRETGTYRNLLLHDQVAAEYMIPMLELFPSRRMIEKLLELTVENVSGSSPLMDEKGRDALHAKLAELAQANPEIATWVDEWPARWRAHVENYWYEELTQDPGGRAVAVAQRMGLDWCSRRLVEGVLALESDEGTDPDARRELADALEGLPSIYPRRPEVKQWVEAWQAAHPKTTRAAVKRTSTESATRKKPGQNR